MSVRRDGLIKKADGVIKYLCIYDPWKLLSRVGN